MEVMSQQGNGRGTEFDYRRVVTIKILVFFFYVDSHHFLRAATVLPL